MGTDKIGTKYFSYRIEQLVGSDSYGDLYRANDESLDRIAALKVLHANFSDRPDIVQRFKKSLLDLAQLNHLRIPKVYYFGKQGNEYFVALEWCPGRSLSNLLRQEGRLPLHHGLKILTQSIEALSAAWKLGIAHGNLKPNNIMVDDNSDIKITDFGIVAEHRQALDSQTISGAISFMAPELVDRQAMDCRADIYSLGIIFHFMLLNRLPSHQSLGNVKPDDSSSMFLVLPVRQVIDRMTREDPQARYSGYKELLEDVKKLTVTASEEPVLSVPRVLDQGLIPARRHGSLFDLLADLYQDAATGVMKVNWLAMQKQFLVRQGEVIFFESTQQDESLATLITSNRWLTPSDISEAGPDPETLIRRVLSKRACTLDRFRNAYLTMMKVALLQIFHWPDLQGEFFPCRIDNEAFVTLRISDILLEASRNLIDLDRVRERIPEDSLIARTASFEELLAPFPLNSEESFLAYRFEDEDMTPDTLSVLTGLPDEKIFRITYLLERIGALELRSAAPVASPPPRKLRATPPAPPPPAAPARIAAATPRQPEIPAGTVKQQPAPPEEPSPQPAVIPGKLSEFETEFRKSETYFHEAEKEYKAGNYGKAAHLCKAAVQHHQEAQYFFLLGLSYANHPRFQRDAEEAFHKAISLAPTRADYHTALAEFYSQRDLWLRARTHCLKALELAPNHDPADLVYQKVLQKQPGKGECWCVRMKGN